MLREVVRTLMSTKPIARRTGSVLLPVMYKGALGWLRHHFVQGEHRFDLVITQDNIPRQVSYILRRRCNECQSKMKMTTTNDVLAGFLNGNLYWWAGQRFDTAATSG